MKIKIPFLYLSTRADLEVEALNIRAAVEFQVASGANLSRANLSGAKWNGSITLTQAPIQISIPNYWMVYILDHHMQIGCEIHTFEEWSGFDDRQIKRMSGQALEFWRKYKPMLMAACEARHAKIEKAAE